MLSAPDGWPLWTSQVRPGREHDSTCARAETDLLPALEKVAADQGMLTLTDLGYVNLSPAFRHPVKKPAGRELTGDQKAYNQLIRGVHGVAERANSLLKTTFKALWRVSLDPWRIGAITQAAVGPAPARTRPHHLTNTYPKSLIIARKGSVSLHRGTEGCP